MVRLQTGLTHNPARIKPCHQDNRGLVWSGYHRLTRQQIEKSLITANHAGVVRAPRRPGEMDAWRLECVRNMHVLMQGKKVLGMSVNCAPLTPHWRSSATSVKLTCPWILGPWLLQRVASSCPCPGRPAKTNWPYVELPLHDARSLPGTPPWTGAGQHLHVLSSSDTSWHFLSRSGLRLLKRRGGWKRAAGVSRTGDGNGDGDRGFRGADGRKRRLAASRRGGQP
jgi:hypothetical protein